MKNKTLNVQMFIKKTFFNRICKYSLRIIYAPFISQISKYSFCTEGEQTSSFVAVNVSCSCYLDKFLQFDAEEVLCGWRKEWERVLVEGTLGGHVW